MLKAYGLGIASLLAGKILSSQIVCVLMPCFAPKFWMPCFAPKMYFLGRVMRALQMHRALTELVLSSVVERPLACASWGG